MNTPYFNGGPRDVRGIVHLGTELDIVDYRHIDHRATVPKRRLDLSLAAIGAIPALIGHVANYLLLAPVTQPQHPDFSRLSALSRPAEDPGAEAEVETIVASGLPRPPAQQPKSQDAISPLSPAAIEDAKLGAAERHRVIAAAIANLKKYYVDPDAAQKMAETLLAHQKAGDYGAMTDGEAFAALLTRQLRELSHDLHLEVVYSPTPLPDPRAAPTSERLARYRAAMEQDNCAFEEVKVLPHNIGYLKLNFFPDTSVCQATAVAAMASLNHADAIIFDLRDNRGGYPSMVMLMAAYLFDHPEYMYNPRENTTERSWTRSPVPGNKLADKPAYVLTSARTFSGAEHFSYNLKMLKRATLVGETTGGATDVGIFHRLDDHFGMGIPETRAINPYSEPDWAVTGVEPDVKVKAADALETAEKLAESKLKKK